MGDMEEVAKHNTKDDVWVVVNNNVINATKFLSEHPGGELVILSFAGKDASNEFNSIHPPYVIERWKDSASFKILGQIAKPEQDEQVKAPVPKAEGDEDKEGWLHAIFYLAKGFIWQIVLTIFSAVSIDTGVGIQRTAILSGMFIVLHGAGNLQSFLGPDAFNGYGYFMVRIYWTGFGLPSNILEEYFVLGLFMHACIGIKRTMNKRHIVKKMYFSQACSQFHMFISGFTLMCFLIMHLSQFRFAQTYEYYMRPPPYLVNPYGVLNPAKIWFVDDENIKPVPVRDIYKLEFDVFNRNHKVWGFVYVIFVSVFVAHGCWGWTRVAGPKLDIPKQHVARVQKLGYALIVTMGLMYLSFVAYAMFGTPFEGYETAIQPKVPQLSKD